MSDDCGDVSDADSRFPDDVVRGNRKFFHDRDSGSRISAALAAGSDFAA